ncbi:sensor histidine kinase [Streptomyces sp. 4F14]|uniref:sensor histidine kinase n=1 Tax=Streptomyces sp. 4F14 TaxID=3394380 RepID=UPI003A85CDF9
MSRFDLTRLPLPAELALAGLVLVLAGVAEGQRLGSGPDASVIGSWLLAVAVCGALPLRRAYPVAVGWCTVLGTGAYHLLSSVDGPLVVIPVAALYTLAARGRTRVAVAMASVMVVGVGAGAVASAGDVTGTAVFMLAGWLVAVVALGAMRHGRVAYAEEQARSRATRERLRIAREVHDVIGHTLSMIHVQASAALHRRGKDPGQAVEALAAIKEGSREGLRELRGTLGVLRQVDEGVPGGSGAGLGVLRQVGEEAPGGSEAGLGAGRLGEEDVIMPVPGLARLDELVSSAGRAGVAVRVERSGSLSPLPPAVDLAAYRIVQESLTNAVRHSRAGQVVVELRQGEGELEVGVTDGGRGVGWGGLGDDAGRAGAGQSSGGPGRPGGTPDTGQDGGGSGRAEGTPDAGADRGVAARTAGGVAGSGIAGMAERARALGGTLRAGPGPLGGFVVRARLPFPELSEPTVGAADDQDPAGG